ncbi:hypothetical protein [Agromyces sp. NPDC049794]|uniref:hypothetical protein n=1 Tax=unclassified Agromyces TaxID=2639701 RepID=UPI0033CB480D
MSTGPGGFFDEDDAAAANRPEPEAFRPPAWMQAPDDELSARLLHDRVLARTEAAVVLLREVCVFSVGFEVHVEWFLRRGKEDVWAWRQLTESAMGGPWHGAGAGFGGRNTSLRFGLALPDGGKVPVADFSLATPGAAEPEPPTVMPRHGGGGGGDRTCTGSQGLWVWAPEPLRGELTLVTEWAQLGIPVTTTTLDGGAIAGASRRVRPLWDTR